MSLLDDINDDILADALAKPAAKRERPLVPTTSWRFAGYIARCREIECPSCHHSQLVSLGVFSCEEASNGTRRLTAAPQFPMNETGRKFEIEHEVGPICFDCLATLGFDDMVNAPSIPTNIAGEGMSTPNLPIAQKSLSRFFNRTYGE